MLNYYQQNVKAFTAVPLTSTYAGNRIVINSGGNSKFTMYFTYARGAAEAASKMFIQLDGSDDGVTWYPLVIDTTGTTSVVVAREWEIQTSNTLNVLVDIAYPFMRMSLRESGVVTNVGNATVAYTLSGL